MTSWISYEAPLLVQPTYCLHFTGKLRFDLELDFNYLFFFARKLSMCLDIKHSHLQ